MRTLDPDRDSLLELVEQVRFTLFRLRRSKPSTAIVNTWEDLYKAARAGLDKELKLLENVTDALAGVDWVDGELDVAVMIVINTLINRFTREHPLIKRFLGGKALSTFLRPRLGEELLGVETWVEALKGAAHKEIQELAPPLGTAIDAGNLAAKALTAAQGLVADFRAAPRRSLFDSVNAERQVLFGALTKIRADDDTGKLPRDYVDRHFKVGRSRSGINTVAAAKLAVAADEEALRESVARLKALQDEETAERLAEEQRAADEKALDEQQRVIAEAQARAEELKRRIKDK